MHVKVVLLQLLWPFLCAVNAEFSADFRVFIHNRYGISVVHQLERGDLGPDGSTGGRAQGAAPSADEAAIIVHGVSNKITRFNGIINALRARGIEAYGTTWGDGGTTPVGLVELKCAYVKQIRSMIIAVREYTGKKVDVIAYSMGSPLARKAILGGICVDTRELLGVPLTEHVDTFLSVAGFLADVNSRTHYEGTATFSIFSTEDEKIGYRTCSRLSSPIVGGTGFVKKLEMSHDEVLDKTMEMQINFIKRHKPK
ncbi:hypothetical protein niasHT_028185 [Heterodera trifolii]|uniref:Triacylglycerol lipase n=1 Tax=Heterodera trifolii TaxID=157864 RepID=A0ABD2JNX8_9BILA